MFSQRSTFNACGVRHDPQRSMGKTVYVPHFNRDTVEFASRERYGSKPEIKILLPFSEKHYGGERFGEFSRSHTALRCLLLALAAISYFPKDFKYCLVLCLFVYFYLRRVKEICSSYLDLLKIVTGSLCQLASLYCL